MSELQDKIRSILSDLDVPDEYMIASDHPYACKCESCLRWWVTVGPEETDYGWSFGPFTEAEFLAAGGIIPTEEDEVD